MSIVTDVVSERSGQLDGKVRPFGYEGVVRGRADTRRSRSTISFCNCEISAVAFCCVEAMEEDELQREATVSPEQPEAHGGQDPFCGTKTNSFNTRES